VPERERLVEQPFNPDKPATQGKVMRSRNTVTVACKLPGGLELRVYDWQEESEACPAGYRTVKVARPRDEVAVLRGCAVPAGYHADFIVGGYAITNVPKDLWDLWLEQNKDAAYVRNGLVWACPTREDARKEAKSMAKTRSGLEPIDPENPQRVDARIRRGTMENINVADELEDA
jgi:hypothetical protein